MDLEAVVLGHEDYCFEPLGPDFASAAAVGSSGR